MISGIAMIFERCGMILESKGDCARHAPLFSFCHPACFMEVTIFIILKITCLRCVRSFADLGRRWLPSGYWAPPPNAAQTHAASVIHYSDAKLPGEGKRKLMVCVKSVASAFHGILDVLCLHSYAQRCQCFHGLGMFALSNKLIHHCIDSSRGGLMRG